MELLFPLIFLALMWFLLVRPQRERVRRHQALLAALTVGDEVITVGGMVGRIVALDDDEVHLEVAHGVVLRVVRLAVNARVQPGGSAGQALGHPEQGDNGRGE